MWQAKQINLTHTGDDVLVSAISHDKEGKPTKSIVKLSKTDTGWKVSDIFVHVKSQDTNVNMDN